jgi:denticleless
VLEIEAPRIVLYPHNNAIFDVKWSLTSALIATASGDRTTYISCPTTQRQLHCLRGHTSTVKCVAWDPTHHDILSTGGRDATVLIWDLRVPGSVNEDRGVGICRPVMTIPAAHNEPKKRGRKGKSSPVARSVTSLIYPEGEPYGVVSSEAFDG